MKTGLNWSLACVAAVALQAGSASAAGPVGPRICQRLNLSDETRAYCARIAGLRGRDLYKATVLENLRRTNQPPVADLKVERVLPRRVDLDASGSTDQDGFPEYYTFQLFDGDTGEIVANPVSTRQPYASLEAHQDLPPNLLASVIVEDDERATDTAELAIPLGATTTNCSSTLFVCSTASGQTNCSPTSTAIEFSTADLLDAAQRCDPSITEQTPVVITAAGAGGSRGANVWPADGGGGGPGGSSRLGTTLADLDSTYGSPATGTTYCYGYGGSGSFGDTYSGGGGASSILRTCQNVSQTAPTGLLLVGGGGGGGGAAGDKSGGGGGQGGIALSTTSGACPPSCTNSDPTGRQGGLSGGSGGSGGKGGAGDRNGGNSGNDGIGGEGGHSTDAATAGFTQGNPQVSSGTGQGGTNEAIGGGSGAGGYGGGGSGYSSGTPSGGGGGGSYAAKSTVAVSAVPGSNGSPGFVYFSFQP
jgi:hypothetical protein